MDELKKWLQGAQRNSKLWKWPFLSQRQSIEPYYKPIDAQDKTLVFESRFESGNLLLAAKVSDQEYKLIIQNDSLTNCNTQCVSYI